MTCAHNRATRVLSSDRGADAYWCPDCGAMTWSALRDDWDTRQYGLDEQDLVSDLSRYPAAEVTHAWPAENGKRVENEHGAPPAGPWWKETK